MCVGHASILNFSSTWALKLGWKIKLRSHTPDLTIKWNALPHSQYQLIDFSGLSRKCITCTSVGTWVCFATERVEMWQHISAPSVEGSLGCRVNIYCKYLLYCDYWKSCLKAHLHIVHIPCFEHATDMYIMLYFPIFLSVYYISHSCMLVWLYLCYIQKLLATEKSHFPQVDAGNLSLGFYCNTSLISRLGTMFQGWRGCVSSVPVPDRWCEEGVWRILQRVQGGVPKVGTLHWCCPCPTAWIGKKPGALCWHIWCMMFDQCKYFQTTSGSRKRERYSKMQEFCAPVFLSTAASQKERWVGRGGIMKEGEREVEMGGVVCCSGGSEKAKAGMTRKAKNVMIQDERKGSRGRGGMAGGGESESERKMEKRREGEAERAVISKPTSHASLCQLQLKSFLLFLFLLLGPLTLPFILSSVPLLPPFSLYPFPSRVSPSSVCAAVYN